MSSRRSAVEREAAVVAVERAWLAMAQAEQVAAQKAASASGRGDDDDDDDGGGDGEGGGGGGGGKGGGLLACLGCCGAKHMGEVAVGGLVDADAARDVTIEPGSGVELKMFQVEKKGRPKWKVEVHLTPATPPAKPFKVKVSHTWCNAVLKTKPTPATQGRLNQYAKSLAACLAAHEARLGASCEGAFPLSSEGFVRLAHYLPLIPTQAKYVNLDSFLSKPKAQDFSFLKPLLECRQPHPAKAAFFSALPKLKRHCAALSSPAGVSNATVLVNIVTDAMDACATAGGGVVPKSV